MDTGWRTRRHWGNIADLDLEVLRCSPAGRHYHRSRPSALSTVSASHRPASTWWTDRPSPGARPSIACVMRQGSRRSRPRLWRWWPPWCAPPWWSRRTPGRWVSGAGRRRPGRVSRPRSRRLTNQAPNDVQSLEALLGPDPLRLGRGGAGLGRGHLAARDQTRRTPTTRRRGPSRQGGFVDAVPHPQAWNPMLSDSGPCRRQTGPHRESRWIGGPGSSAKATAQTCAIRTTWLFGR